MGKVITIDSLKCTGCRICEISCSLKHSDECNPELARIRSIMIETDGELEFVPSTCMQCEIPMCEAACPTKAISRDAATGAQIINEERCIGCSACSYACPFGACFLDRSLGISVVCDRCDGDPICVKLCPTNALQYVPIEEVNVRIKRERVDRLQDSNITI